MENEITFGSEPIGVGLCGNMRQSSVRKLLLPAMGYLAKIVRWSEHAEDNVKMWGDNWRDTKTDVILDKCRNVIT